MARGQSGTKIRTLEQVNNLARSHTKQAVQTIANIMKHVDTADAVKLKAAEMLLDRAVGKPTQKHEQTIDVNIQAQHLEALRTIADKRLLASQANKDKLKYVEGKTTLTIEHVDDVLDEPSHDLA